MKRVSALLAAVVSTAVLSVVGGPASGPASASASDAATAARSAAAPAAHRTKGHGRYKVPTGAYFNNPRGDWPARLRIELQILHAIQATQRAR